MKNHPTQSRSRRTGRTAGDGRNGKFPSTLAGSIAVLLALGVTGESADVTSTWNLAGSGLWNVNANWSNVPAQGGFPNDGNGGIATYDAVINAAAPAYTVTLSAPETVEHFTLNASNATVAVTGGALTANTGMDLTSGSLLLNGGTISNSTINAAAGTLNFAASNANLLTGVTVNGDLTLNTAAAVTKIAGGTTFTRAHLAANAVSLGFAPGQTLNGTVLIEGATAGTRHVEMNGTAGALTIGASGVLRTNAGLTGDGEIGGSNYFGGAMTLANQGLISSQVSGRTITINAASLTNSGTMEAINGGILTINSNSWTNAGTMNLSAGTVNLGGTFNATGGIGSWTNTGGTVNITGTLNPGTGANALTLNSGTGSWTLSGGTISGGTVGFAGGQSLLIAASNANLLTGVTVNGDLTLNTAAAVTKIAGGTTFTQAHLAANAVSLGFAPGQTLNGTILIEGASAGTRHVEMNGTAGALTIGASGVLRTNTGSTGDGEIGGSNYFGGAMTLANQGLISSQVSGRTITINAASLANSGTLEAINGGILSINSNSWTNAGTINLNAGTVNLGGTFNATGGIGSWSNTGGTVNITGTLDPGTGANALTLNNGTGSWTLSGGTISGGTVGFAGGQSLLIGASNGNLLTGVTVNGDLTLNTAAAVTKIAGGTTFTQAHLAANAVSLGFAPGQTLNGTVLIEGATAGTRHVEMNGTAGALTIGASGVLRTNAGLTGDGEIGGSNYFGGAMTLANQGLISSQVSGRTITINAASLSNSGTLEAINGGILSINSNSWTNGGTIKLNTGTVNLGGTFNATGGIGSWTNTGGTVNITGTVDPGTGANALTLNSGTGSWTLSGGTISGGTVGFANGQALLIGASNGNLLTGVTVNGDLTLNTAAAVTKIAGGTTFTQAHLAANGVSLGFAPGQTLNGTILIEGASAGTRHVEMNGTAGALTIGASGVLRTNVGLTGDGEIGGSNYFGGAMTLANQGLISSQVSGRTITINAASLSNSGTLEAINGGILTINSSNWTNAGTINLNAGTVNLGGTFNATGGIGSWSNTNGTVNITGTVDPGTGANALTLNNGTGSWTMSGGTISGGTVGFAGSQSLLIGANNSNLLTGVTVNGDLTLNTSVAVTKIAAGTTFTQAHLAANGVSLGFAPGQTLTGTVLIEGATAGTRHVEMNGTAGALTIGASGVIRTNAGLTGDGDIGGSNYFGGAMTLANQGLISSQVSGRTITINAASLTNSGTLEAINGGLVTIPNGYTQTAGITRVGNSSTITAPSPNEINITGGQLEGAGTIAAKVASAGTIAPGLSAGTAGDLKITNDLSLAASSALQIDVGGLTQGTQYDLLSEAGTVPLTLQGTLSLALINSFMPAGADTFTVLTSNQSLAGAFSNVANGARLATSDGLASFQVNYGPTSPFGATSVVLSSFATPEPECAALLASGGLCMLGRRRRTPGA